ncbi:MAG: hypothetical protein ACREML_02490 [Vulcanimicrobiaceae bacterium]
MKVLVETSFGPLAFWAEIGALFERAKSQGREWLSYEEWDEFFAIAKRHKTATYVEKNEKFSRFAYGGIGLALLNQYRSVKAAREEGIDAYQFHLREKRRRAEETQSAAERQRIAEIEAARAKREREVEARKTVSTTRTYRPRAVDEREEIQV